MLLFIWITIGFSPTNQANSSTNTLSTKPSEDSFQIDDVLQEFASKCCQHNSAQNYEITTIMNADGIYLATYSALLLNLKLMHLGHYEGGGKETAVPLTETQFVDEIHGSGVLVYVSATWLCELYQNVLAKSMLEAAGYDRKCQPQPALINLLTGEERGASRCHSRPIPSTLSCDTFELHHHLNPRSFPFGLMKVMNPFVADVGGLCPTQLLTDWQKLQKVQSPTESCPESEAGVKLSRRVLTCCWTSVVAVLGGVLGENANNGSATSAISRLVARRARQRYRQRLRDDIITASLEGLHKVRPIGV